MVSAFFKDPRPREPSDFRSEEVREQTNKSLHARHARTSLPFVLYTDVRELPRGMDRTVQVISRHTGRRSAHGERDHHPLYRSSTRRDGRRVRTRGGAVVRSSRSASARAVSVHCCRFDGNGFRDEPTTPLVRGGAGGGGRRKREERKESLRAQCRTVRAGAGAARAEAPIRSCRARVARQ